MKDLCLACAVFGGLAAIDVVSAGTVEMNGSDGYGESSWNSGKHWTGGAAPAAGNDYVIPSGKQLRTPNEASPCPEFLGDSLAINGALALKNKGGGEWADWVKASQWILGAGGTINAANGGRIYLLGPDDGRMTVLGTADNPSCLRVSNNNAEKTCSREIRVRTRLTGESGTMILVRRSDDDPDSAMNDSSPSARVKFSGDNSAYYGAFEISRIPGDSDKERGAGWHYIIDFGQDWVPGGSVGVKATMGAGVDSGDWLTMGHQTVLNARGMPFTSRYPLRLGNAERGDTGGDVRITLYSSNDARLSGRRGNESAWFGDGAKITGSGSSVLSIVSPDAGAVAFGDVTITGVDKITVASPATLRFYPGYDNPTVPFESNTTVADEADGIGPLTLKAGGFLTPGYGTQGIGTMGLASLTMEAGSFLYYSAKPTADGGTTNDFIRIAGNLVNSTGGKIKIGFDALCTSMKPGDKLALLSAANLGEAGVTANDFELDNTVRVIDDSLDNSQLAGTFSIETVGGAKTLVFTQTSKQVVALVGKDTKGNSCFAAASSSSGAAHWSNNAKPSADYDYIVPNETLLRVNSGSYTFAGHSLSILRGGCFGLDLTYSTVDDLRLYGGAKMDARDQTANSGQSLKAGVTVYATRENPVTIENTGYSGNYCRTLTFRDGSTLKGTGDFRFQAAAGYVAQEPNSTTYVNWDATDFTGGIVITGRAARVSFKDEKAMGGPAPSFRADRLRLEGNGQLVCWGAYTMSDPTRGICIGGGVTNEAMAVGGTIAVWSGPLVISNLISGTTMLRKIGDATLKLCCPSNSFSGTFAHKQGKLYVCHRDTLAKAARLQCYDNGTWFIDTPDGMTVSGKGAFCRDGNSETAKFKINLPVFDALAGKTTVDAPIFRVKGATLADAGEIESWIELVNVPARWKRTFTAVESDGELVVSLHAEAPGFAVIVR